MALFSIQASIQFMALCSGMHTHPITYVLAILLSVTAIHTLVLKNELLALTKQ